MMKTTKKTFVTRFVLKNDFVVDATLGLTYRKGRVLKTIKNRRHHYYPSDFFVVMGHGLGQNIPAAMIEAKWLVETTTVKTIKAGKVTTVTVRQIPVI